MEYLSNIFHHPPLPFCYYVHLFSSVISPLPQLLFFIYRLETYETNLHPPSRVGTRVRVAATNILNINLSAANLDVLGQAVESWRKQRELEKKAVKIKVAMRDAQDILQLFLTCFNF